LGYNHRSWGNNCVSYYNVKRKEGKTNRIYRVTSEIYTTITSECAVTETQTVAGSEVIVTYTTLSTIVEVAPTTYYATTTLPGETSAITTDYYTTITSECPVYETSTIVSTHFTVQSLWVSLCGVIL